MVSLTLYSLAASAMAASVVSAAYGTSNTTLSQPPVPTTTLSACEDAYNKCRVGTPGNSGNQAACAAQFVACGGTLTLSGTTLIGTPTTSSSPTTTAISNCEDQFNKCRVGTPGNSGNQAACAAQFVACGGTLTLSGTTITGTPTTSSSPTTTAISDCEDRFNKCRVGTPGQSGNQAACAAEFVACGGTLTLSGTTLTGTPSTYPGATTTTKDVTIYTTICPATSTYEEGGKTLTTTYITTSTITSCKHGCTYPTDRPLTCQEQFDKCRVGTPGMSGNQAACAAEFVACGGTLTLSGTTITGTSSSYPVHTTTAISECEDRYNKCRVGTPGMSGNQAACAAEFVACGGTLTLASTTISGTAPAAPSPSAGSCQDIYNKCRVGTPGQSGNQAACAADFIACGGTLTLASTTITGTPTGNTAPTPSAATCQAQFDSCRATKPDGTSANQAQCAAEFAACNGSAPAPSPAPAPPATTVSTSIVQTPSATTGAPNGGSTTVEFTGSAKAVKPAVGLVALAAAFAFI